MRTNVENYLRYAHRTGDPEILAYLAVLRDMPEKDRLMIDWSVNHLVTLVPNMGVFSAFELIAKLGVFLAKPGGAPLPPAS
jgi:hypothetical protein